MRYILLYLLLLPISISAQEIDMDRMHRDLKVAENGLKSLIGQNEMQDVYFKVLTLSGQRSNAQYINEYGVIIDAEMCEPCLKRKKKKDGAELTKEDIEEHLIDAAKTFLADYAGIIGQLRDDQKIMIRYTSKLGFFMFGDQGSNAITLNRGQARAYNEALVLAEGRALGIRGSESGNELKVEAKVADIRNHFQGNISRDEFLNKIKVDKVTISTEVDPQLETFVAMFYRLYQKDLSSTYYMSNQPRYSRISDVGIMINAKVYSSNSWGKDKYDMPTINKEGLTLEERNREVQKMLPNFEKEFKENIINYARTIRSENANQAIIFDVRMTQCEGCDGYPKFIKFSVSQDVINNFNKGKLTFDQAVSKVSVERRTA